MNLFYVSIRTFRLIPRNCMHSPARDVAITSLLYVSLSSLDFHQFWQTVPFTENYITRNLQKSGNARFSITGFSLWQGLYKNSITPIQIFYTISFRQQKLHYKSTMSKSVICLFYQQAIFTPFEAKQCQTIRYQIRLLRVRSCLQHPLRSWSTVRR